MLIGYARVSTDEQTADLQLDALRQAGCERIFVDNGVSGSREHRPALNQMLGSLGSGDTLVTWKLDRLGRSLIHLVGLITTLEERGVGFRSLADAIDTSTSGGRFQFHVLAALAEFERSLISERTKAGIAAARVRGASFGRPAKLTATEVVSAVAQLKCRALHEVARTFGVSPPTLRRAIGAKKGRKIELGQGNCATIGLSQ